MSIPPPPASLLDNQDIPAPPASLLGGGDIPPPPASIREPDEIPTKMSAIQDIMDQPKPPTFKEWQDELRTKREMASGGNPEPPSIFGPETDRLANELGDRMDYAFRGYHVPLAQGFSNLIAPDWKQFQSDVENISAEHPAAGKAAIFAEAPFLVQRQALADVIPKTAQDAVLFAIMPKAIEAFGEMFPAFARPVSQLFSRGELPTPAPNVPAETPESPEPTPPASKDFLLIPKTTELATQTEDPLSKMIDEELRYQKALEDKAPLNRPAPGQEPFVEPAQAERAALNEPVPDSVTKPIAPEDVRFQMMPPEEITPAQRPLAPIVSAEEQARLQANLNATRPGTSPEPGPMESAPFQTPPPGVQRDPDPLQGEPFMPDARWRALKKAQLKGKSTLQLIKEINDMLGNRGAIGPGDQPPSFPEIEPHISELVDRARKAGYDSKDEILAFAAREGFRAIDLHKIARAVGVDIPPTDFAAEIARRGTAKPTEAVIGATPTDAERVHAKFLQAGIPEPAPPVDIAKMPKNLWAEAKATHQKFLKNIKSLSEIATSDRPVGEKANLAVQFLTNRLHGIEKYGRIAESESGGLPPGENPKFLARSSLGLGGKLEAVLKDGTFRMKTDGNIEWTGPSFYDIVKPIADNAKDFDAYLTARAIIARSKSGVPTPPQFTAREAHLESYYQELLHPEFRAVADQIQIFGNKLLLYLKDSGRIGEADFARMKAAHEFYVPLERLFESMDTGKLSRIGTGTRGGAPLYPGTKNPLQRVKGTDKTLPISSPLETYVNNIQGILSSADRNRVGLSLVQASRNSPTLANVIQPAKRPGPNTFTVYIEGLPHYFTAPELLLKSLNTLDPGTMHPLVKFMSLPARSVRVGATGDPNFAARNPLRDWLDAMVNAKFGFNPLVDPVNGVAKIVGDTIGKNDLMKTMRASGGFQSFVSDISKGMDQVHTFPESYQKQVLDMAKNPLKWFELLSNASEEPTRAGVAARSKASGASDIESAFEMRNATGDYGVGGSGMREVNALHAFLGARIVQDRTLVESLIRNPQRALVVGGLVSNVSFWNWMAYHNQQWYKEMPPEQKNLYWPVMTPKGLIKIPKGTIGGIFGTPVEKTLDYLNNQDPDNMAVFLAKMADNLSPMSINQGEYIMSALKPAIEAKTNYDYFRQRPVVPASTEGQMPMDQYAPDTSETMKQLAFRLGNISQKVLGVPKQGISPAILEHLATGYFPGLGRLALRASDIAGAKTGLLPTQPRAPLGLPDYPVTGAFFMRDPIGSRSKSVNDFYENMDLASRAEASFNAATHDIQSVLTLPMAQGGLPKNLAEAKNYHPAPPPPVGSFRPISTEDRINYVVEKNPEFGFFLVYKGVAQALSALRNERQSVVMDPTLSDDQKREAIQKVEQEQTDIAREVNTEFDKYMQESKKSDLEKMLKR